MNANLKDFAEPTRYAWLTALAGKYVNGWLTVTASALATVINEDVKEGGSAGNHRKLSPYVSLALKPFAERGVPHPPFLQRHLPPAQFQ